MADIIGKSLGRYHILDQLGEGGMAIVYKAYDTRLESDVAVKVIRTERLSQEILVQSLKRFEREAKALAQLTHPNLVKVLDYGEFEGRPYLVMPYLPGGTLKQLLKNQPMPWQEAARLLIPIARSLEYAHKRGLIHRDIKPSNILITESGEPMLTDFGIAKIIDDEATMELTGTSVAIGTPEYMAPEQVVSKSVDHRADIYALGIVYYEMVTGRRPYQADTPMAVLFKHASEPLPRPTLFVSSLPENVEKILLKALAKSPNDRYQSMAEFGSALETLSSGSAAPVKPLRREPVPEKKEEAASPKQHTQTITQPTPVNLLRFWPIALIGCLLIFGLSTLGLSLVIKSFSATATESSPPTATEAPAEQAEALTEPAVTEAPTVTEGPTAVPISTIQPVATTSGEGCAPGATRITWFIGLGAGSNEDVIPAEKAWVEKYNKSQKEACILLNIVYNDGGGGNSYNALRILINNGDAPDIVGPVGKYGRASFQGAYADVNVLARDAGFDLNKYDQKLLDFSSDEGVLVGLPFALFPSFIFYNERLFDQAQLPYPPHNVGEKYDGRDWNLETFSELSMKLTVDANGNDATSPGFNPNKIVQFGFYEQWTDARGVAVLFGGGIPYDEKTGNAVIPDSYKDAWKWYYDGIWKYHFMPNADYQNSDQFNMGNMFPSGNLAMAHVHTWYTCCFDNSNMRWDIAVMPEINGKITAKLHGDTFAILKDSKHQDIAFKVLTDMVVDPELTVIYGGMPAVEADRPAFFAAKDQAAAPNVIDWSVAEEMLNYPDLPNHEAWLPNLAQANSLLGAFRTIMDTTPGLDLDAAIARLEDDLNAAYEAAP